MLKKSLWAVAMTLGFAGAASADAFINGGFDNGTASGWVTDGAYRGNVNNPGLTAAYIMANSDGGGRSAVISAGTVDPNIGALLGTTVYGGTHSYRAENTFAGGYASLIQQQVNNYSDPNIFFAWKSLLLGAHGVTDAATMKIELTDLTDGVTLIQREYNAAAGGGGVDARFSLDNNTGFYYTPDWQIEQLAIGAGLAGHDFLLSVIAADCSPTAHTGYVYLDGFGAVIPDPQIGVPEPASMALLGLGLAAVAGLRRMRKA